MTETPDTTQDVQDDVSLDSFFAKKDKSKKPKKKKTTKSDETSNAADDSKGSKKNKGQGDDWNDFKEEKEKDYSSLKIQDLTLVEDGSHGEVAEETPENENGDDEDGGKRKKKDDGKWNVDKGQTAAAAEILPELPGTHNVIGGKYIPPSVKRSAMMGSMGGVSRKSLAAPDIQSKAAFPTLSAANQDASSTNNRIPTDFEMVKKGTRSNDARLEDSNQRPRLDLGNRYDGLRN